MALNRSDKSRILRRYFPGMTRNSEMSTEPRQSAPEKYAHGIGLTIPIPEPIAGRAYSGKFMVRVPPETHRALALQAAEAGVSLNRLISARLAGGAG